MRCAVQVCLHSRRICDCPRDLYVTEKHNDGRKIKQHLLNYHIAMVVLSLILLRILSYILQKFVLFFHQYKMDNITRRLLRISLETVELSMMAVTMTMTVTITMTMTMTMTTVRSWI